MRISDWSSDVCSSDLVHLPGPGEYRAKPGWLAEPSRAVPANRARRRFDKISRPPAELRLMCYTSGGIQGANEMCKQKDSNSARVQRITRWIDRKSTRLKSSH